MRKIGFLLALAAIAASCAAPSTVNFDDDAGTMMMPAMDAAPCTTMCNGMCADLKTDNANCGKCGTVCPMSATCVQGSCQCPSGTMRCGSECVDVKTDGKNCGKCGQVCGADAGAIMGGGTWGCTNGVCAIQCPMGRTECGGACVETKTDMDHCGMCGNACMPMTEQCIDGLCCPTGQKVCNNKCTDTQTDAMNCGMCGNQCPMNAPSCGAGMCTSLYTFTGVKTNLPISMLAGWQQCYKDLYNHSGTALSTILNNCNGNNLLLACRQLNSQTLIVAAHAPRADVIFNTGTSNTPRNANGVGWYYSPTYSWGFAGLNDALSRSSCDTGSTNPTLRLCWHTGGNNINGGWRCGSTTSLNSSTAYERLVYQAN